MELDELLKQKLINKKLYHPVYGEIGFIKDILTNTFKYIIFKERSLANLTSDDDYLRAIPANHFYIDQETKELMVNFPSDWIKYAPKFTSMDMNDNRESVVNQLDTYYNEDQKSAFANN